MAHNTLKALALRLGRKYNTLYRQAQALGIEPVETIGNVQIISDTDAQRLADYDVKRGPIKGAAPGNGKRVSAEVESPFDVNCRH